MVGKGGFLKSWGEVKEGDHLWVQFPAKEWGEVELQLHRVHRKIKGGIQIMLQSGALLDVTNPKACVKVVGEVG